MTSIIPMKLDRPTNPVLTDLSSEKRGVPDHNSARSLWFVFGINLYVERIKRRQAAMTGWFQLINRQVCWRWRNCRHFLVWVPQEVNQDCAHVPPLVLVDCEVLSTSGGHPFNSCWDGYQSWEIWTSWNWMTKFTPNIVRKSFHD